MTVEWHDADKASVDIGVVDDSDDSLADSFAVDEIIRYIKILSGGASYSTKNLINLCFKTSVNTAGSCTHPGVTSFTTDWKLVAGYGFDTINSVVVPKLH
jgi:hypothetical protein